MLRGPKWKVWKRHFRLLIIKGNTSSKKGTDALYKHLIKGLVESILGTSPTGSIVLFTGLFFAFTITASR